jgi:hypothetical protein
MHSKTLAGIEPTNTPYVISTPGGRVITKQLVMYTPLNLAGKLFRTSLIVLDGQGIKGNLAPRYIGPYPIIEMYGPLSYQQELSSKLSGVHNVFHVSQLKRCLKPPTDVVIEDTIPLEPDLTYKAYPVKILEQQDRTTQKKTIIFYKVQWNDHSEDEATWERIDFLHSNFSELLPSR